MKHKLYALYQNSVMSGPLGATDTARRLDNLLFSLLENRFRWCVAVILFWAALAWWMRELFS